MASPPTEENAMFPVFVGAAVALTGIAFVAFYVAVEFWRQRR